MKREERLRKNYEFKRVYQEGKARAAGNIVIFYRKNEYGHNRLGVSISKKVGKSVVRHRLKRIIKEAFTRLKDKMQNGYDIVVVVRRGAAAVKFGDMLAELARLFKRGKIME